MVTLCEKRKCKRKCACESKCTGFPPSTNDKVVTDQTDADALPDVVDANLFITNVTNASISVPSYEVKGSVFVSGVTVNSGVWKIEFPNLKSVGCDVVVGRDTISPHSDKINEVFNSGSQLSVLFPSLKFVQGNLVVGMVMRPGTVGNRIDANFVHDNGNQLIRFSALQQVCQNVVIGTFGDNGINGCASGRGGVQTIEMKGRFAVHGNLVVGIYNEQGSTADTFGNFVFDGGNQHISIECETVRKNLVYGRLGIGRVANYTDFTSVQVVDFPVLCAVEEHLACGVLRGYSLTNAQSVSNFSGNSSIVRVLFPNLVRLHASLTIGQVESPLDAGNYCLKQSVYEIQFPRLVQISQHLTFGSDVDTPLIINFVDSNGSAFKVNLANLLHVKKGLNVGENYRDQELFDYDLRQLCYVGKQFNFLSNGNFNLSDLNWTDHRPLRCIGGPLVIKDNVGSDATKLTNLDGLSSLACISSTKSVIVKNNDSLVGYCGLHTLATDPNVSFEISGNAVNPTKAQIATDDPCSDAARFQSQRSCFAPICCPPNVTVECPQSLDPIVTGYPTSADPGAVFVYVDTVVNDNNDNENKCSQGCVVQRQWRDSRCCTDAPCTQLIVVRCLCKPLIKCPLDVTLKSGDPYTPATTGTATCECQAKTDKCLKHKICAWNGEWDAENMSEQNEDCTVSYNDKIVSTFACTNAPKHVERTWSCTNVCGNTAQCIQNIYFHRPDRFPLCDA